MPKNVLKNVPIHEHMFTNLNDQHLLKHILHILPCLGGTKSLVWVSPLWFWPPQFTELEASLALSLFKLPYMQSMDGVPAVQLVGGNAASPRQHTAHWSTWGPKTRQMSPGCPSHSCYSSSFSSWVVLRVLGCRWEDQPGRPMSRRKSESCRKKPRHVPHWTSPRYI